MHTFTSTPTKEEILSSGEKFQRKLVVDTTPSNEPQSFTVYVKDAADWEEIHNYIINENEIDGIPNRKIECISDMPFSEKRSVYNMSAEEASVLRSHPKVEIVVKSSMHNPIVLEQRKLDAEFDKHCLANRFKRNVVNRRAIGTPTQQTVGAALTFTQWGLLRHSQPSNAGFGQNTLVNSDIQYSLTGKNVDVVIMDTGVRWDHPEFLKPGYTSVPVGVATVTVSRVRDILIHGASEYGINWATNGLTAPGSGLLANYTVANVLQSSTFNGSWHGSHVAGTSAGNQFGAAFEANIWSIACIDRDDVGFADPSDGFDYIRVWHKNKPINPETGRRNPTIVNGSWGLRQFVSYSDAYTVSFRGRTYPSTNAAGTGAEDKSDSLPPVWNIPTVSSYYQFTSKHATSQATCDELFDDPDCKDLIVVLAAGNSGGRNGKQDLPGGIDWDNRFLTGTFYYGNVDPEDFGAVDEFFNRPGTPAITHLGQPDAPIVVGSLAPDVIVGAAISESRSEFSNHGPAVDIYAAGDNILSPWDDSPVYQSAIPDARNPSFYNQYLGGTSMATPNVCGVIATYLQSNPSANRVDVRRWLFKHGSQILKMGPGHPILDTYGSYTPNQQVGAGTSVQYWTDFLGMRGSTPRILYNPFANNTEASFTIL